MSVDVSIVIPVLNKLEFTRQCLERLWRHSGTAITYEVVVVDNASTDGTADWFANPERFPTPVRYLRNDTNEGFARANNRGARLSAGRYLLFLNNDTLVQPGWLDGMVRIARADGSVGIVGIKQLFPYTNTIYHTGIVFTPEGRPEHLYPHLDASLPTVNKEREYQAVTGACLLIERTLFNDCGGFDEEYVNGYEDVDLCLAVRERGRKVVCCTSSFIYHYGQISEGRTDDDDQNAARFARKWAGRIRADRDEYLIRDGRHRTTATGRGAPARRTLAPDCIYLADSLEQGSALTWINVELALALRGRDVPVFINWQDEPSSTVPAPTRRALQALALKEPPVGGVQIKWSHYWPRHMNTELAGDANLEFFVINYAFTAPHREPWDFWLQGLGQNGHDKLPLSDFCESVLRQIGVPASNCHVWYPGYSGEIDQVEAPRRNQTRVRFLTVTNSHDLERYNTAAIVETFRRVFRPDDGVTLVIKDYGASSGDETLRRMLSEGREGAPIEYVADFSDKAGLMRLYKSCDAFVSAHRGEGFGMKILDAMACGLPVVTPLFGGPTSYCHADNCLPVRFSEVAMGDCLDTRSLRIANGPVWAEVDRDSLGEQMRRVYEQRELAARIGAAGRASVVPRFSWDAAAARLVEIASAVQVERRKALSPRPAPIVSHAERSPYWLGLRVSVVVPTHNRKEKLLACLDALERQTVLFQEFEVIVIDDGSSDGTAEAIAARKSPFALSYFRQDQAGPGPARNLGIAQAAGELVLIIGDDIVADERLLEEHLLAHGAGAEAGLAVLGRIDWPETMPRNAVMEYVCGDAALQFAYTLIPTLPALDHRFFYTSNISLKRKFLVEAAEVGIGFDPDFRRAAFEDSELAFRLMPRGLRIQYASGARAFHDHPMDLESFARREFAAGEMAVVFYRKHPGEDDQLLVKWIADLVEPAAALAAQPDLLRQLEAFDRQTDALLSSLASSLESMTMIGQAHDAPGTTLSAGRLRAALHNVLRVLFDVHRTRGKLQEWYANVEDPSRVKAAQTLATAMRKIEFLTSNADQLGGTQLGALVPDPRMIATLRTHIGHVIPAQPPGEAHSGSQPFARRLRGMVINPAMLSRLLAVDRRVSAWLQTPERRRWLERYQRVRSRVRRALS